MPRDDRRKGFVDTVAELVGPAFSHFFEQKRPRELICHDALSSFLESFAFERGDERCFLRCPSIVHSPARVSSALERRALAESWRFADRGESWSLELQTGAARDPSVERFLVDLFADLNGLPSYTGVDLAAYEPASSPLVSCVVVLTFNDRFCLNYTIPSIIEHSAGTAIEIIVVHNGIGVDVQSFLDRIGKIELVYSEFLSNPCANNRGVEAARGEYVALFHDDCFVADPSWLEKCLAPLNDDCILSSAESARHVGIGPVPKAVPMVLRKRDYLDIGGFDQRFWGTEEVELALRMKSRGKTFAPVDLTSFHFGGMSAGLLFAREPAMLKSLFSYPVLDRRYANAFGNVSTLLAFRFPLAKMITDACNYYISRRYAHELDPTEDPSEVRIPELGSPLAALVELFHMHSHLPGAAGNDEAKRRAFEELLTARRESAPAGT